MHIWNNFCKNTQGNYFTSLTYSTLYHQCSRLNNKGNNTPAVNRCFLRLHPIRCLSLIKWWDWTRKNISPYYKTKSKQANYNSDKVTRCLNFTKNSHMNCLITMTFFVHPKSEKQSIAIILIINFFCIKTFAHCEAAGVWSQSTSFSKSSLCCPSERGTLVLRKSKSDWPTRSDRRMVHPITSHSFFVWSSNQMGA